MMKPIILIIITICCLLVIVLMFLIMTISITNWRYTILHNCEIINMHKNLIVFLYLVHITWWELRSTNVTKVVNINQLLIITTNVLSEVG
jgi:hypothetical protein